VSERDGYTPEEWRTLQFAPFWIFSAVIGAYDRFDPRDYRAFVHCLEAATMAEGRLGREVLASVVADRERLLLLLLGPRTEQIPFIDGTLCLGQWQRVLLFGFNGDARADYTLTILG